MGIKNLKEEKGEMTGLSFSSSLVVFQKKKKSHLNEKSYVHKAKGKHYYTPGGVRAFLPHFQISNLATLISLVSLLSKPFHSPSPFCAGDSTLQLS